MRQPTSQRKWCNDQNKNAHTRKMRSDTQTWHTVLRQIRRSVCVMPMTTNQSTGRWDKTEKHVPWKMREPTITSASPTTMSSDPSACDALTTFGNGRVNAIPLVLKVSALSSTSSTGCNVKVPIIIWMYACMGGGGAAGGTHMHACLFVTAKIIRHL